jgi:hypothetical protein
MQNSFPLSPLHDTWDAVIASGSGNDQPNPLFAAQNRGYDQYPDAYTERPMQSIVTSRKFVQYYPQQSAASPSTIPTISLENHDISSLHRKRSFQNLSAVNQEGLDKKPIEIIEIEDDKKKKRKENCRQSAQKSRDKQNLMKKNAENSLKQFISLIEKIELTVREHCSTNPESLLNSLIAYRILKVPDLEDDESIVKHLERIENIVKTLSQEATSSNREKRECKTKNDICEIEICTLQHAQALLKNKILRESHHNGQPFG